MYLTTVFGDLPAVSMIMRMKGHNGLSLCCMCKIDGLPVPNTPGSTHYMPLDWSTHSDVINTNDVKKYDPLKLLLHTHNKFLEQARKVQQALSTAAVEWLAKEHGIKGVPVLSLLSLLFFPLSFPGDFNTSNW